MKLIYNAGGTARKEFARAAGRAAGEKPEYLRAPTFGYRVGPFTIDWDGNIETGDMEPEKVRAFMAAMEEEGFHAGLPEELAEAEQPPETAAEDAAGEPPEKPAEEGQPPEELRIAIKIPAEALSDQALVNLGQMLEAKRNLIEKAMGVSGLPVEFNDEAVIFPWFETVPEPKELEAYQAFLSRLLDLARKQKRVTAKEKAVENEKYAFRCFLLRLGFIGKEFKEDRKILLRNFAGSSAFKGGTRP